MQVMIKWIVTSDEITDALKQFLMDALHHIGSSNYPVECALPNHQGKNASEGSSATQQIER